MQWSRSIIKKDIATNSVLEFVPEKIDLGTPSQAIEYLNLKGGGSHFSMGDAMEIHTGVDKIERDQEQEKIEAKAIEMLKQVKENAYKEAYDLGMIEGRNKAFEENSQLIQDKMQHLEVFFKSLEEMKMLLYSFNEAYLIKLMYQMAKKIAMKEVSQDPNSTVDIIRNSILLAQDEENIVVSVAPSQVEFLEELKKHTGKNFDFIRKIKLEANESIKEGGCIIETNYGQIDATIEQRLEQLWDNLSDITPKIKDTIASE